jgi:hypothetical protein
MPYAAFTAAAPAERAALLPLPPATTKLRGNPNLGLAPAQPARGLGPRGAHTGSGFPCRSPAAPPVPIVSYTGDSLAVRELASHAAGLRAPANRPPQGAPTPDPTAPSKPSRIDPLNREPTAKPGATVPFKPSRIDPLNREPAAKPGSTAPFKPSRIDPLNREPAAKPGSTAPFKPFRIDPLNREPGALPDPELRPVHRFHDPAHIRESTRRAAHAEPAPQARKSLPRMNADER